jgi:hypothetical protein
VATAKGKESANLSEDVSSSLAGLNITVPKQPPRPAQPPAPQDDESDEEEEDDDDPFGDKNAVETPVSKQPSTEVLSLEHV